MLRELRARQKRESKTLGQLASELLAQALAEGRRPNVDFVWSSASMGVPRVDLEGKDAVWAVLDQWTCNSRRRARPSMRTFLVYASTRDSDRNEAAHNLVAALAGDPQLVVLFWPVIVGYIRIATHPSIFLSPSDAAANVTALLERPHVRAVGEQDGFWDAYRHVAEAVKPRGNFALDIHLVALMRQHSVPVIWTDDRDFRRFDGIAALNPFA